MVMLSSFHATYRAWPRLICKRPRMSVFAVEFRNAAEAGLIDGPRSSGEVKAFPGGPNDCVSGIRYISSHAAEFRIDPEQLFVAGESVGATSRLRALLN
mmetsp:Transcript_41918/g.82941  ORF Transcript_41918/g.82941 Transcript_41918/m.82941 type:complete len:99 (+) Transcript_41918:409-705(+)